MNDKPRIKTIRNILIIGSEVLFILSHVALFLCLGWCLSTFFIFVHHINSFDRNNFPCVDCGLRPFAEFLNNEQKRINNGKNRFNLCGRCLLPECSLPGCTNRSPKAIYATGTISARENRKQYICGTCQPVRCAKCDAPALKKIKDAKVLQGSWYCAKKV